eukprot:4780261-Amphidinium_carterae.2
MPRVAKLGRRSEAAIGLQAVHGPFAQGEPPQGHLHVHLHTVLGLVPAKTLFELHELHSSLTSVRVQWCAHLRRVGWEPGTIPCAPACALGWRTSMVVVPCQQVLVLELHPVECCADAALRALVPQKGSCKLVPAWMQQLP